MEERIQRSVDKGAKENGKSLVHGPDLHASHGSKHWKQKFMDKQ